MNIAVFGASGNIGRRVTRLLLEQGHSVVVLTHHSTNLPTHPALKLAQGDIHNRADVEAVLADADIVVSTLGSWGTKEKDILTAAMGNIVPAMQAHGITRIISLTGAGVLLPGDHAAWYDHLNVALLGIVAPKILHDGETHINILAASQLDWTVLRSPVMTNRLASGYALQSCPPLPWQTVSRDNVAQALVDLIDSAEYTQEAPFVADK
ncbi:MAG: NAD(P)H-binding protein [Candidatus Saccharimonas sp.]